MIKVKIAKFLIFPVLIAGALVSCDNTEDPAKKDDTHKKADAKILNKSQAIHASLNGKVFSIPSPIETAMLLKEKGGDFDSEILNDAGNVDKYVEARQKALIMGVYGADLGYATIYDQNQESVKYFKSVEKLARELGIAGAFDKALIERFMENGNNQDSLLSFVSLAYAKGDAFLKENKREDVAIQILAGGWIESIYFASQVCQKTKNEDIMRRIGEQKPTLNNLYAIYKESKSDTTMTRQLKELKEIYRDIRMENSSINVIDQPENKLSIIQNESTVSIDETKLGLIAAKITEIRNSIIQ